jgi:NADH-quinone oxidoreductase subunit J
MSAGEDGYVLPFEFISLFLLACIIGGLVVSRIKSKEE